jgi:type VI secretion system protein ImpG
MQDELLPYYERELTFIRQMCGEFRKKYPEVASGLELDSGVSQDPHVERLIEAFALLAGRIHHKLDDEFPEITEGLLEVLYPHFLRPIPPQGIVQFQFDSAQSALAGLTFVPAGNAIHTKPIDGQVCSFRTCYPVTVLPLRVTGAGVSTASGPEMRTAGSDAAAVIRIDFECPSEITLRQIGLKSARIYLGNEKSIAHTLYELMLTHPLRIVLRDGMGQEATLPVKSLKPVGYSAGEGSIPYSDRSFLGYRLLQEYFTFPEKFLFVDIDNLDSFLSTSRSSSFQILITVKQPDSKLRVQLLEQAVDASSFQLNCTPVVNLFERIAEPIRVTHAQTEYCIVADQHRTASTEIFSVDRVTSTASYLEEAKPFEPFYSVRHSDNGGAPCCFWYARRRPSMRANDNGTEVYLSTVDPDFEPTTAPTQMLSVYVTCTNRDQVARLRFAGEFGEVDAEGQPLLRARFVRKPTSSIRPSRASGLQWRLISHLSLNHLSIVDKGRDALLEILRLYDFSDDPAVRKRIAGIVNLTSKACVSRFASATGVTFCRGVDVTVEFDENEYQGTSAFLLASVLRHFLGLYSAVNSFTRVTARTSKGVIKAWPPLAGEQIVL